MYVWGGVRQNYLTKSIYYIFKIYTLFKPDFKKICLSKGTVLIEFAICMPVLIIMLFYVNDLVKIQRHYSLNEFVGQQIVNLLQNISQKRANKAITKTDMRHVAALAFLSIYPGTTMFHNGKGHVLIHNPELLLHCVKGEDGGKARSLWIGFVNSESAGNTSPNTLYGDALVMQNYKGSLVTDKTSAVSPTTIYKDLKISSGEIKILVETATFYATSYKDANGNSTTLNQAYNLRFSHGKLNAYANGQYFVGSNVVIFTPKPGLFNETGPS